MTVKCPDCKRANTTSKTSGKIKCRKCLQIIEFNEGVVKKVTPKELNY